MFYGNAYSPYYRYNSPHYSRSNYYEPQYNTILQNQPVPQYKIQKFGQLYDFSHDKKYGQRGRLYNHTFKSQQERDQYIQNSQEKLYYHVPQEKLNEDLKIYNNLEYQQHLDHSIQQYEQQQKFQKQQQEQQFFIQQQQQKQIQLQQQQKQKYYQQQPRFMPELDHTEIHYEPQVQYVPVQSTHIVRDVQGDAPYDGYGNNIEYGNNHYKNGPNYNYTGQMSRYWAPSRYIS